jgi:hypothetical protein
MNLASRFEALLAESCAGVFAQARTRRRAAELALGALCALGRRTLSRAICAVGRQGEDWSADYKLYSRSPWQSEALFDPVLRDYLVRFDEGPICAAMDDTKLAKRGRRIATATWQRDPLSPPFHVNLLRGLRFMQVSLLYPHYRQGDFGARGLPVRFGECPVLKKPGKRATDEQRHAWRQARKQQNLSRQSLAMIRELRERLDALGALHRALLLAVDGSLTNRTIFRERLAGVELVGRCRKDAALCLAAPPGSRRRYAQETFTPEGVRQAERVPWHEARVFYGGQRRTVRYKEVPEVLWRRGAGTRPLRLLVLAPQPYRNSPNGPRQYHDPAYLLATDLKLSAEELIQCYLDRWQIEVNHRDEKQILGVGQAQVWSPKSVPRQPAFAVAAYSLLLLAGLQTLGPGRGEEFIALPKWRKQAQRASALDYVSLLRKQLNETRGCGRRPEKMEINLVHYAYT